MRPTNLPAMIIQSAIAHTVLQRTFVAGIMMSAIIATASAQATKQASKTFCNPFNLPYNFQKEGEVRREAADPVIVLYKNKYWLFASKQQGYWFSDDMITWTFVRPEGLPLDVYAPSATVVNDKLCYTSGNSNGTFTTNDPFKGVWTNVNKYKPGASDPALFQDTDGKVYLYDGCSDKRPLQVTEMDAISFLPKGPAVPTIYADTKTHGWEVPGEDFSNKNGAPWIEGSYINKINGKYYLQYAAPGTQFKTYADGVYISDNPTGPFTYAAYSPFSFKPTGFMAGAGHSSTFQDKFGEYWHIATGTISIRHMFERRLAIFPTAVLADGQLVTNTYLGDYPQYAPGIAKNHLLKNTPQWMLLSYNKPATASSTLAATKQNFNITNAFDEDIRTWWSAESGKENEWLQVDLQQTCKVNAIQINFADQDCVLANMPANDGYRYILEASTDGKKWNTIINRRDEAKDAPHDYIQLDKEIMARYIRITNVHYPANGRFSIYDLRVFGKAPGNSPKQVKNISVVRDAADKRTAHVKWDAVQDADFYIVRYGLSPDRLFGNYQVYKNTTLDINALNTGDTYYYTVDAINGAGIAEGAKPVMKY